MKKDEKDDLVDFLIDSYIINAILVGGFLLFLVLW